MSYRIPVGVDDFARLVDKKYNYQFVDKSLFIKEFIDNDATATLIVRPRRWGKTLNMSMLSYFLGNHLPAEITASMFADLQIATVDNGKYLADQGQHPVIFISLKDVKKEDFEGAVNSVRYLLKEVYAQHSYLLDSDQLSVFAKKEFSMYLEGSVSQEQIEISLLFLSRCLKEHFNKKVFILVDEYDTPLNCSYHYGYIDRMTLFMRNFLSYAMKGNTYLAKGIMTGILRISKDSMLSGLNNLKVYSMLHEAYARHFGFMDAEVTHLFEQGGLSYDMEAVRRYYNGYRIDDLMLYNPWSIMECLSEKGKVSPYWVNTASDKLLKQFLVNAPLETKEELEQLIGSERHTINNLISDSVRFEDLEGDGGVYLWSLLFSMGYLTVLKKDQVGLLYECELAIPNQEVREVYIGVFQQWMIEQFGMRSYNDLLKALASGDIDLFAERVEGFLMTYASHYDFTSESNYHTFMLGLLCSLTPRYYLFSNAETGKGRADMMLIPKDDKNESAIIMEFKYDKKQATKAVALAGLDQINMKSYQSALNRYSNINKVLKIGLAFSGGKEVASAYCWDVLTDK